MESSLGIITRLSLCGNASVPSGLDSISAYRSFLTRLLCLPDVFTDPGVLRIPSFPSRLFFRKGFVLPYFGAAQRIADVAEPVPPFSMRNRHH